MIDAPSNMRIPSQAINKLANILNPKNLTQYYLTQKQPRSNKSSRVKIDMKSYKSYIKSQLQQFFEYITKQFLILTANYQAKLQYKSLSYEQQISELKQQIQRQYKVIGLMKQQLQQLVILVNQRTYVNNSHRNNNNQNNKHNTDYQEQNQYFGNKSQENGEWRIRKMDGQGYYQNHQNKQKQFNGNSNNLNQNYEQQKLCNQQMNSSQPTSNSNNSYYTRTISGLQIIAEQQTQRTLMSLGEEQDVDGQYEENDYIQQEELQQNENQRHQQKQRHEQYLNDNFPNNKQYQQSIKHKNDDFMRIQQPNDDDSSRYQNGNQYQQKISDSNLNCDSSKAQEQFTLLNKDFVNMQSQSEFIQQGNTQNNKEKCYNDFQSNFKQYSQNSQNNSNFFQPHLDLPLQASHQSITSEQISSNNAKANFTVQNQKSHFTSIKPGYEEQIIQIPCRNRAQQMIEEGQINYQEFQNQSQSPRFNKSQLSERNQSKQQLQQQNKSIRQNKNSNFVPNPFGKKKSRVIYTEELFQKSSLQQSNRNNCSQNQFHDDCNLTQQNGYYPTQQKTQQQIETRNKIYYYKNTSPNLKQQEQTHQNGLVSKMGKQSSSNNNKKNQLTQKQIKSKLFLQEFKKSFIQNYYSSKNSKHNVQQEFNHNFTQFQEQFINEKDKQTNVMSILEMIAMKNQQKNKNNNNINNKNSKYSISSVNNKPKKSLNNHTNQYINSKKSSSSRSISKGKKGQPKIDKSLQFKKQKANSFQTNSKPLKPDHKYYHQTQQRQYQNQSDHQNDIRMIRMSTDQNYKNNNCKDQQSSEDARRECLTSSFQQREQIERQNFYYNNAKNENNFYIQEYPYSENHSNNNTRRNDQQELRSLQTTFGRPKNSQCSSKQPLSVNNYVNNLEQSLIPKKYSTKSTSNNNNINSQHKVISGKQNKQNYLVKNNKKHSYNYTSSGVLVPAKEDQIINNKKRVHPDKNQKKSSYYQQNKKYPSSSNQQSIHSMIQSHLQSANKFMVGCKKQELKYDGEKIIVSLSNGGSSSSGIRHGHGILYYSNGLIYDGEFVQGRRQGFGILKFNHVQLYAGEWQKDQLSGQGKIRNCAIINKKKKQISQSNFSNSMNNNNNFSNINISNSINTTINHPFLKWISYCGQFKSNRFEGQGTLYLQGGQKFVGTFRNGASQGEGSWFKKNGEIQVGVWKNNVLIERLSGS